MIKIKADTSLVNKYRYLISNEVFAVGLFWAGMEYRNYERCR